MEICITWWGWIALALIVIFNVGLIGGLCFVLWQTYKNAQQDAIRITALIGFMVEVLVIIGASLIAIFPLFTFPAYTTNESYVGEPKNYMYGMINGLALVQSEIAPTSKHKNRHNGSWRLSRVRA